MQSAVCRQMMQSSLSWASFLPHCPARDYQQKDKVVVVMGSTGAGKTRLSVDLADHYFPAEIINSDKMQVYKGLDVVTNKITKEEQRGVKHHLLGIANPESDFKVTDFCDMAMASIDSILRSNSLPIIVGGSNSYLEHLIDCHDHGLFRSKYDCCFLWVDVSLSLLDSFLRSRVDQMIRNGMLDEVRNFFDPNVQDYSRGIRKAIGVPEFDRFLRNEHFLDPQSRALLLREAIEEIKDNNCKLASRQLGKIQRLRKKKGWKLHRLDATEVFLKRGKLDAKQAWEKLVAGPSYAIVSQFLFPHDDVPENISPVSLRPLGAPFASALH